MSKIKEYGHRQSDYEMDQYVSFCEWLDLNRLNELSESDINKIEEETLIPSPKINLIISYSYKVANNIEFCPVKGA